VVQLCILMELYDKLFTQFPTNLSKHNATGRLQHPIRHPLNVRSADLHVRSHTVATAANPTSRMNRALKQQANQLGPNTWQQRQEMAKYDTKFHIFLFHHHSNLPVGQQHCRCTAGRRLDHRYIVHIPYHNIRIVYASVFSCLY